MRYYIIAGERSGDLHAGNLARELAHMDDQAVMRGFGGDTMKQAGVDVHVHYSEMAVMGFWEVLMNLRKIAAYLNRCKQDILSFKPDVVILVDYGGFNKKIAAWATEQKLPVYYYISPKVWAWNQGRAWKLKATVTRMFVILPFEKDFFKKFQWDVDYVGNPVLDAVKAHYGSGDFKVRNSFQADRPIVAFLPGSRKQELYYMLPILMEVAKQFPEHQFALAAIKDVPSEMYKPLLELQNVRLVMEDTYNLLQNSSAAVVTSGTATLETALFGVPQVVVYKTSPVSYFIARSLIRVPYISLVNLIANKEVVRELIQGDLTAENVASQLQSLLSDERSRVMRGEYQRIYNVLDIGSASKNAASLMYQYLRRDLRIS